MFMYSDGCFPVSHDVHVVGHFATLSCYSSFDSLRSQLECFSRGCFGSSVSGFNQLVAFNSMRRDKLLASGYTPESDD